MTHEQRIAEIRSDLEMAIEVLSYGLLSNIPMERTVLALKNFNTLAAECLRLREDKERLDWLEKERPNVLCLCKFNPETFERIDGYLWEVGEMGKGYETLRQALDAAKEVR